MSTVTLISVQSAPANGHARIAIACCQMNTGVKATSAGNLCRKDSVRTRMVTTAQTAAATGHIDIGSVCCRRSTNVMIMEESVMRSSCGQLQLAAESRTLGRRLHGCGNMFPLSVAYWLS